MDCREKDWAALIHSVTVMAKECKNIQLKTKHKQSKKVLKIRR